MASLPCFAAEPAPEPELEPVRVLGPAGLQVQSAAPPDAQLAPQPPRLVLSARLRQSVHLYHQFPSFFGHRQGTGVFVVVAAAVS